MNQRHADFQSASRQPYSTFHMVRITWVPRRTLARRSSGPHAGDAPDQGVEGRAGAGGLNGAQPSVGTIRAKRPMPPAVDPPRERDQRHPQLGRGGTAAGRHPDRREAQGRPLDLVQRRRSVLEIHSRSRLVSAFASAKDGDGLLGTLVDDPFDVTGTIPERRHVERGRHREQWIGIITGRAAHRELNA